MQRSYQSKFTWLQIFFQSVFAFSFERRVSFLFYTQMFFRLILLLKSFLHAIAGPFGVRLLPLRVLWRLQPPPAAWMQNALVFFADDTNAWKEKAVRVTQHSGCTGS